MLREGLLSEGSGPGWFVGLGLFSGGGEGRGRNGHPKARAQCGIDSGVSPGKVEVRGRVRRDASYLERV